MGKGGFPISRYKSAFPIFRTSTGCSVPVLEIRQAASVDTAVKQIFRRHREGTTKERPSAGLVFSHSLVPLLPSPGTQPPNQISAAQLPLRTHGARRLTQRQSKGRPSSRPACFE